MITELEKKKISQYFTSQPVELVYLFRSQAQEKTGLLSDYDFAVLFVDLLDKDQSFDLKLKFIADFGEILQTDK